jgi:hypothetical protein
LKQITINDLEVGKIQDNTILWVKTITYPCQIASVNLIVEDRNKDVLFFSFYNQIKTTSYTNLEQIFPIGTEIGIKQPYLLLSYTGTFSLRNDNPCNIILKSGDILGMSESLVTLFELKERA